ncbi:MAG: anti-sigma factor [Burkholderiales bacterium]|nr:anti-sigma factor [Burkholderiales bacterium]
MTEEEDRVEYADQNSLLRRQFDTVLTEPIPARMYLKRPAWLEYARAAVLVAVGIAIGLAIPLLRPAPANSAIAIIPLPIRAARAHLVYSPEVRHPVEVEAKEQDHLVKWLSKRLDLKLRVPVLTSEGFELLGGRLLPGSDGPVAQFMYQDASGKRLTLYVTRPNKGDEVTAFRFAKEGPVSVFYWIDRDSGYALSGEIDKPTLARVASSVYRQLEP